MKLEHLIFCLNLICNKNVDFYELKRASDVQSYNSNSHIGSEWLSEEDFEKLKDLLKEVPLVL